MIDLNKNYNEDALETMRRMPNDFINMVITSPPYDNLRVYKGFSFDFENIAKELFRVLKKGGVIIWVVADQTKNGTESGTSFKQALYFKEIGFKIYDTMIFKKKTFLPLTHRRYEQEWEYMFCFSKGIPKTFNPIKLPSKHAGESTWGTPNIYKDNSGKLTRTKAFIVNDTKIKGNIFEYGVGSTKTGKIKHPAMFPEELVHDQMITWSEEGEVIYDPFMGSGTVAKVAIKNKRNWIGSETSEEYCKIIDERVKNANEKYTLNF